MDFSRAVSLIKIINSYKEHQQIISNENRDRSPHSSPERHSQLVEEDIVSSSDDGIILTQEPIDLDFSMTHVH